MHRPRSSLCRLGSSYTLTFQSRYIFVNVYLFVCDGGGAPTYLISHCREEAVAVIAYPLDDKIFLQEHILELLLLDILFEPTINII